LSKRISSTATATPSVSLAPTRFPNLCYYSRFSASRLVPFSVQNLPETPPRHFPPPRARGVSCGDEITPINKYGRIITKRQTLLSHPQSAFAPRRCCQRMRVGYKPQNLLVVRVRVIHSSNRQKHHSFPLFLSFFFFLCSSSTTIVVEPNLTAFASAFALSSHPSLIALHPPLIISDIHSTPLSFNLHTSQPTFKIFGHESVLRSYLIFTHLFPPRRPSYRSTFRRHSSGRGPHLDACFGCTTASLSPL
ncbi:hypothetical protein M408DRAFT_332869, partial [Serendipita vermifera MAFF 305830]